METILALRNKLNLALPAILTKDGRHYQIFYLGIFLLYGIFALDWSANILNYLTAFGACLVTQAIGIHFTTKNYSGLKSAAISALSICLMLKANLFWTIALTAMLSIGSKFLIRYKGKHVFNPTNFGIVLTVLLTGDAWISPGQWGSNIMLWFLIGACGFSVLFKVGRIDTSLSFLLTFAGAEFIRSVLYLGWDVDFFLHQMSSGTLLLFSFFMITDPVTTPNAKKARIIWAGLVGLLAFAMTNWFYVHSAPIWALFIISPITVILDRKFKGKKFKWNK